MKSNTSLKKYFSNFFKDKNGHLVIGQFPNVPIIGWFVFMLAVHLISTSQLKTTLEFISTAFLFTWAYLEISQGVNYFRRLLGLIVLIVIILSVFK